jgi:phthiocerol/phenolphthiocerol synthesis type-I polyketide synthase B
VERLVRSAAAKVLKLPVAELDIDRPLGTLGLNSLMGIELRNAIEVALGRPLPATLAWSHPTVRALASHLASPPAAPHEAPEPRREPAAVDDADLEFETVAAMSDDEALAALLGGRA